MSERIIMRSLCFIVSFFCFASTLYAEKSIDERINEAVAPLTDAVSSVVFYAVPVSEVNLPLIIVWLISGAAIFTFYMGFINIRGFKHAVELVRGDYDNPTQKGEVSHFQALAAALSGTVGLGNIAGVAIAVSVGGAGATFWMILAGVLGMSSKFVECTLGVKYRNINDDGSVSGGPMYYLSKALAMRNQAAIGKFLGGFFALMCVGGSLGAGNMFQVNQAFKQFVVITGESESVLLGYGWLFGLITAVLVGLVIIGGIKSIVRVTDKIVPIMCGVYILATLVVLTVHIADVPRAI
ncbi:MAG: alanine/glycine:cation symporter family protein, partial [Candidatus Thermochlorobacter sp.]